MSLRDTISGAVEEVSQSGNPFARTTEDTTENVSDSETSSNIGFSKRSTARAKPSRAAAGSVRYVSGEEYRATKSAEDAKNLTRAERHAKADRKRSNEDRRATVARYILNGHAEYKRSQRIWWSLIGVGIVVTILTWGLGSAIPANIGPIRLYISVALLVLAYGCVIGSFIYDWRVVRPMRKAAEEEAARMSDKRIKQYLDQQIEKAHEAAERGEKPSLWDRISGNA